MVFNATFNNTSVISTWSVLLLKETRVPGENHRPVASHLQTLSHNVTSSTPRLIRVQTHKVSGDRHRLHKYIYVVINPTTMKGPSVGRAVPYNTIPSRYIAFFVHKICSTVTVRS